ncbi:hypothetical protein HDU87_000460 [Geranomyces variabilis]|uniref:Glyoxal oxidase n=1 Tax=Geranomyces variabilis TaxID=109894 RepID=A0AAD5XNY2_9FUNG|nr:hypothetical protein HDU87_000460 [Geranomyces variabilis]
MLPPSTTRIGAAATLLSAAATSLAQQTVATGNGSWAVLTTQTQVVPIHMLHFPGDKLTFIERVHDLNPIPAGNNSATGMPYTMSGDGFTQEQYDSHNTGATSKWFHGNANVLQAGFLTDSAEFDVASATGKLIDRKFPVTKDLGKLEGYAFCSGHAQMADGNFVVVGGDQFWDHPYFGANRTLDGRRDIRVATPSNATSTAALTKVATIANLVVAYSNNGTAFNGPIDPTTGDTSYWGRWYPSVVTLPDERVLIMGGHSLYFDAGNPLANNPTWEIFDPVAKKSSDKTTNSALLASKFPLNLYPVTYVLPHSGDVWMHAYNDSVKINIASATETPHVAHDLTKENGLMGRNFPFVGSNFVPMMSYRDDYKMEAWFCGGVNSTGVDGKPVYRSDANRWYENCPNCPPTKRCNSLELEGTNPQWQGEDMPLARSQPTAINLPDGTILLVSGSGKGHQGGVFGLPVATNGVKAAVIFNPRIPIGAAGRWTVGSEALTERHYHNAATLLEDGTVVTGGGDSQNGADPLTVNPTDMTLDVYSPPYKSIANPPQLVLPLPAPSATYGQRIIVPFTSAVAQTISQVSIIRYGSGTHSTNLDQRHIELEIVKYATDKLLVKLPANANIAQPGNWMLWAVDSRGAVVSRAGTVNIRASNPGGDAAWNEADTVATPVFTQPGAANTQKSAAASVATGSLVAASIFALASLLV